MPITNHAGKWGIAMFGLVTLVFCVRGLRVYQKTAQEARDETYDRTHELPNVFARQQFIGYSTADVARMEVYGADLQRFEYDNPIIVTDPKVTGALLRSLQNATSTSRANAPQNGLSGGDTLQIDFKSKDGQRRETLRVPFNARRAYRWYGTEFENALNSIPQYQAKRVATR